MNGDESITFGAAMYANHLNKVAKARDIELIDGYDHRFAIKISNLNPTIKKGDEGFVDYEKEYRPKT